jgi:gamma-glutamyltranspeptidase / glutathione hydrolase
MVGAVASAHPLSTGAGQAVLDRGGNAYDATLAVSAALTVVQPHMNGMGSDFFAVVDEGTVRSINASGWAAAAASVEAFRAQRLRAVPVSGPKSAITVPGLVGAWSLLGPLTSLRWTELFAPAVRLAREGFLATASIAGAVARTAPRADADWRATYAGTRAGRPLRQSRLGRTLEEVGRDRGESFYHGRLARAIDRDQRSKGGLLCFDDLDRFEAEWTAPLRVRYRGVDVFTTPPNSQGATALLWLNLLAREDLASLTEGAYVGALARTMPVAYAYRSRVIGDPKRQPFPPELLAPDYPYARSAPLPGRPTVGRSDTTAFSVFDGRVGISAIQSNYMGFGSGVSVGTTGITLNNRGAYFSLDPSHPNVLEPGKRTFHTLMAIAARGPTRRLLLGSMGGDVQPQVNVQVLTRVLDRGEPIARAIAAPRFAWPATIYGTAERFAEPGVRLRGARLVRGDRDLFGHAHAIDVGARVEVGLDPRGDAFGFRASKDGAGSRT